MITKYAAHMSVNLQMRQHAFHSCYILNLWRLKYITAKEKVIHTYFEWHIFDVLTALAFSSTDTRPTIHQYWKWNMFCSWLLLYMFDEFAYLIL